MITDDEVVNLFARADPARSEDPFVPLAASAFLDDLRSRESYVADGEATRVRLGPSATSRRRVLVAVAAAGVLVAGALVLASRGDPGRGTVDRTDVTSEPAPDPADAEATAAGNGFVRALGALDADALIELLGPDAELSELAPPGGIDRRVQSRPELRLLLSLLTAQGYEQTAGLCEVVGHSVDGALVRCPLTFSSLRSGQFAPERFGPDHVDLVVHQGAIVRATTRWAGGFDAQVWDPFAAWMSTNHPADANVMYPDGSRSTARLSEPSIRLWELRTREYAARQGAAMVRIADAFMAARDDHDREAVMSFMAAEGAEAQLCNQGLTSRYACVVDDPEESIMDRLPLDRAELTFAFEAEALLGLRFEDPVCEKAEGPLVTCSYRMDTRLRRIAELPPVVAAASLGVVDGHIGLVAFPWLNIEFAGAGRNPVDAEPFVHWLEREHPEVLGDGDLLSTNGSVFRVAGQELILVLTRPSLARLAAFLDEYEAAGPPAEDGSTDGRLRRRVASVLFSIDAPSPPWTPGPIRRLADAEGFRTLALYVSQSTEGPQGAEAVVYWTSPTAADRIAQPCALLRGAGEDPTASELADLVAAAPGTRVVVPPSEVTLGGRRALHVALTVLDDEGCDPGYFYTWGREGWGEDWGSTDAGDSIDVWIIDVDGTLLVIVGETKPDAGPEAELQVQQVVRSIRFET